MVEYRKPNPELAEPETYGGPSAEQLLALRKQYLMPNHVLYYKSPIAIVRGEMQYVYDSDDEQYLDAIGGIVTVSVGHCNPRVLQKTIQQMKTLQHATTIYLHPAIVELAQTLAEKMPSPEDAKKLVKKIAENYELPYFSISPTFSVCPIHGYITGEHEYCPKCDEEIGYDPDKYDPEIIPDQEQIRLF